MFDYLVNYGIQKHSVNYEEIDINDRLLLQDQINSARKNYSKLISLLDDVHNKYLNCASKMSKITKRITLENVGVRTTNSHFATDDEYMSLDAELQALKSGMAMINTQIDFYKNDLKILNSVFYNKF